MRTDLDIIKKKSVNEEVNSKCLYRAHLIPLCLPNQSGKLFIPLVRLKHLSIRNCDGFDVHTRRTIDGIIALLSDFIKSITTRGNVTHESVDNCVSVKC